MTWLIVIAAIAFGLRIIWVECIVDRPRPLRSLFLITALLVLSVCIVALPLAIHSRRGAMEGLEPVPREMDGRLYLEGLPCTDDCSGHLEGWRRAQGVDVDLHETLDCKDLEFSVSMAEGCRSYLRRSRNWWRF